MKIRNAHNLCSRFALLTATTLGTVSVALATPQLAPSGDLETSDFLEVDIQSDTEMNRADIDVSIVDGIATLRGSADSLAQVERASLRAYDSPRVMVVVNEVEIVPASSQEVKTDIKDAFENQFMFEDEEITINADGSRVTLTGNVGSWDEADLARELASEITGVTAVKNDLKVDFGSVRTNKQIEDQLAYEMNADPLFTGLEITPEVKEGIVHWSGQVGSQNDLDSLVVASYVTGVTHVNISKVDVNDDLDVVALEEKEYTAAQSKEALDVVLNNHTKTKDDNIETEFVDGVAVLTGTVDDQESLFAALLNTRVVPGVDRVVQKIEISETDDSNLLSANIAPRKSPSAR